MRTTIVLMAGLLATAAAVPVSAAEPPDRPASESRREGFLVGFSLGAGGLGPDPCDDCGLGVGRRLPHRGHGQPRGGGHAGGHRASGAGISFTASSGSPPSGGPIPPAGSGSRAAWASARWIATTSSTTPGPSTADNDYVYPSLFGAGGVEAVRSGRFTIDIQLRGAGTHQRGDWAHSVSVNVGLNWY